MNEYFHPSGRKIRVDQAVAEDLCGENFINFQFQRLVAKNRRFIECKFSYSNFDSCYLRNCTFDSCDFTGCKFTGTNLRGSKFIGCKFDYAQFSHTLLEPELLDDGCPSWENLQWEFARTLRMNFHQIGDAAAVNKAIKIELQATGVHLHKAWRSRESYYRKKYSGFQRVKKFIEWLKFISGDFCWGNGENPFKLIRPLFLLLILVALFDVYFRGDFTVISSYASALFQAPGVLLGVDNSAGYPSWFLAVIALLRFTMMAFLVSILIKKLSRR